MPESQNVRRWMLIAGAVPLLTFAVSFGCGKPKPEAAAESEAATPVQVAAAATGPIVRVVEAEAILFPINQANIMPKISAPVRRILVNRGDHVRAGQLVAELENRDLAAAAAESRGQYEQAQASYRTTTAATIPEDLTKAQTDVQSTKQALDAAQKVYESRQQLLREGAIARKLVDDAQVAMVQAQSQAENAQKHLQALQSVGQQEQAKGAKAQVEAAQAHYQSSQAQLSYAAITSPISGVVSDRPVYPGEIAAAGAALISVVDISQVVARANIPVAQAVYVRAGQAASLSVGDAQVNGKVTVVSPAVDPNSTTVEVWVQAANPNEQLKPGVTVKVSIRTQTIPNAVTVPPSALLSSDEGGQKVMVVNAQSKAEERAVEVGVRNSEQVQIVKGVSPGDKVVITGGLGLEDKAKVEIQKASAKQADPE